jgi:predicted metal-dependent HD superfamily phosphohydrolase
MATAPAPDRAADRATRHAALWAAWRRLGQGLGWPTGTGTPADALGRELVARHDRWPRRCHDTRQLAVVLQQAAAWRPRMQRPDEVELALWFHDAVRDPWRVDNEARSARFAQDRLTALGLAGERAARVAALVRATAHRGPGHAPEDAALFAADGPLCDARDWVLDLDLAPLAAAPEVFDRLEADLKREYFWIRRARWAAGRGAAIERLLAQPRLFRQEALGRRLEGPARANLQRALQALRAAG